MIRLFLLTDKVCCQLLLLFLRLLQLLMPAYAQHAAFRCALGV